MAEQFRLPYGDVFLVQTPTLDKWAQQLYVEQKTAEAKRQQENALLDANIQKELGKVRSVDTPDVINSYNEYKQLRKQLLFNKDLQKDPLAYNDAQLAAQRAYQNIFTTANRSAEIKDMQKQLTTDRMKNPNAYSDDFGSRMGTLMQTPISGLTQHQQYGDLTNWDSYRYQGSNTDFSKILRDAIGQPKQVYTDQKVLDGGLQTQLTPYMFGNTPGQVKDYLLGSMALHQTGRDAAYQWDQLPEQEIENTIKQYQAIPRQKWQRMGLDGPQDLLSRNPNNKAENFAAYQAMRYAIDNEPKEGTPVFRDNKKAVLDWQLNKDKIMEGIKHGNRMSEIAFRKQFEGKSSDEQDDAIDELYDALKIDALKNRAPYKPAGAKPIDQYDMKVTDGVKKLFSMHDAKGHVIYPDQLRFSKDFNNVTAIFFEHYVDEKGNPTMEIVKDKDGRSKVEHTQTMLEPEFKERWKKEIMGAGSYGKSLSDKKAASSKKTTKDDDPIGLF